LALRRVLNGPGGANSIDLSVGGYYDHKSLKIAFQATQAVSRSQKAPWLFEKMTKKYLVFDIFCILLENL
jgi:hypothetical protein